jgi:hydroxymethylpyrimidine/phosphomethylpyrimidine kinase
MVKPLVLSLAGSDPSGGAGLQQDLKVFEILGCHGMGIETLLTVQTQHGLRAVHPVPDSFLKDALFAILQDLPPLAVKIGAMGTPHTAQLLAGLLPKVPKGTPIVVDPILGASRGKGLGAKGLAEVIKLEWLPRCALVTPNLGEAEVLAGGAVENVRQMEEAARRLGNLGAKTVLVKGGHLAKGEIIDVLWDGQTMHRLVGSRLPLPVPHGTGCALSAAITCYLAKRVPLPQAVERARELLRRAWPQKGEFLEF